jgi:hypothetical protein
MAKKRKETVIPAETVAPPRHGNDGEPEGEAGAGVVAGQATMSSSPPEAALSGDNEITIIAIDEYGAVEAAMAVAQEAVQAADDPDWQSTAAPSEAPQAATAVARRPVGRPSIYTDELAATICQRLSSGHSLRSICREEGMPDVSTIMGWVFRRPEFFQQYRAAREMQAELMADEMQDIADDGSNDWMERHNSKGEFVGWMENGESIKRSALRINTRQWIAARLLPKRWGDKQQVTHQNPDGTPVTQTIDPRTLTPETREALADALRAAIRQNAVDTDYEEQTP